MVKRTHGYRYKSRKLLRKKPRERGMRGLSRLLYEYKPGDRVVVDIDPTFISTAPHRRYQGKVGVVIDVRGRAYVVETYLGDKKKIIITTADHLRPFQGGS
jgi:large subunit ribosomal protein L21e